MKNSTFILLFFVLGFISTAFAQHTYVGSYVHDDFAQQRLKNHITEIPETLLSADEVTAVPYHTDGRAGLSPKKVVLEESTGTWCQWCPKGNYYADSLALNYENVFVIAVHGYDAMENTAHLAGTGLAAYPSANVNRSYMGKTINQWFSTVNTALQEPAVAELNVTNTFDATSRSLTVNVSATFEQAVSGDYRFAAILLEDGVTGPAPAYSQVNQYSGGANGFAGGYELLPSPVPAHMIAYNHVSRQLIGGYGGAENSLPSTIAAGSTHSYSFETTIPQEWDHELTYVIALLIDPSGKIENAAKSAYLNGSTNAKPVFTSSPLTVAFVGNNYAYSVFAHDPDNANLEITASVLPSWLTLSETSSIGHIHDKAVLSGTPQNPGTYNVVLRISDGENTVDQAFTIVVEGASAGEWTLVGEAGFTTGGAYNQGFAVAEDGTLYLLTVVNNLMEVYKKQDGSNWTSLGLAQANASSGQVATAPDGTPFIAYSLNWSNVYVKKYVDGAWVQVGSSPTSGNQIGLVVNQASEPIIAVQDANYNYQGVAYKFNGTSWVQLGGGFYSTVGNGAAWNVARLDDNDNLYILWGAFGSSGTAAHVSKLTDSGWQILGGQAVGQANVYYYQSFDVDNNGNAWVAYPAGNIDKKLEVYHFDGSTWSLIGDNLPGGAVEHCGVRLADDGTLYISFIDFAYNNTISAMSYDGSEWSYVGPRGFTNSAGKYPQLVMHHNTPIIAYADLSLQEKASVQAYNTDESAAIYLNPQSIDFGNTPLDQPSEAEIIVTNLGSAVLNITEISSTNDVFIPNMSTLTIPAGASVTVTVSFEPEEALFYEGVIRFQSNDPVNPVAEVTVSGTGIIIIGTNELQTSDVRIYPNPSKTELFISGMDGLKTVQIQNSNGQRLIQMESTDQTIHLSTEKLTPGVYFVNIITDKERVTRKLVVK